jgi:uncharacterized protein
MKYLFWLLVIGLVWWAWRRSRPPAPQPPAETAPQDMVVCAHCGIHLPHDEAVTGTRGQYCSTAHRSAADDRNPD